MAQPATPLWLTKRRIGDEGLVAQLEDPAGEIPAVDVGQEPTEAGEDGRAIGLAQSDNHDSRMRVEEMGDGVKEIPVGGEQHRVEMLGFGK